MAEIPSESMHNPVDTPCGQPGEKERLVTHPEYRAALEKAALRPSVMVAPTNFCNFRCSYCSTTGEKVRTRIYMNLDLLERIVRDCVDNGWPLSFGQTYEPFLHPQIREIIGIVTDAGLRFSTATNAFLIRGPLRDLPMNLNISISDNARDYAYRGVKIPFESYIERIAGMLRHRMEHDIPGSIQLQFSDYTLLEEGFHGYDRTIRAVGTLASRMRAFAERIRAPLSLSDGELAAAVAAKGRIAIHGGEGCTVTFYANKIMPNTHEFLTPGQMPSAARGYCDSCWTMMSVQADGGIAYCCSDPTAKTVFHRMTPDENLRDIWEGSAMARIREGFLHFRPRNPFCLKCLYPVSEHIKPLLTVCDRPTVAKILRENGITEDRPWFSF